MKIFREYYGKNEKVTMSGETRRKSKLPTDFYKRYDMIFKSEESHQQPFYIKHLKSIALVDPFPKEERSNACTGDIPLNVNNEIKNVYPEDRYRYGESI